ncbi:hypothetical protein AQ505_20265 [Pedobacter sp. PACM 27299]|uniref:hypothetical protein n=1 Tax=Pedobacter sp. PACM 27299 TaxID=1727164 RepID=UPI0007069384|nr:hypothetical protein [Pedobacter sp. PACM 27299]ALL07618.1 hypothetical protein AQ505_20265 [Pedobacter sp. PACM 27299]
MKISSRLLILSLYFFSCNASKVELPLERYKSKYKLAYDYLIINQTSQKNNFTIADSTVNIDLSPFYVELSLEFHKSKDATLFELDSLNHTTSAEFMIETSDLKQQQNKELNRPTSIIFFSKMHDYILAAEILDNISNPKETYKNATSFNNGTRYLFIFDKRGKIKNVYKKGIQYN